jgi:hypothetical protein
MHRYADLWTIPETNIIRNFQIKTQERRNKNIIKRNRGRSKRAKNARNI